MPTLAETILQFGTGRFLRAFVDRFVHQANASGQNVGRVVVVQSTGSQRAELLGQASAGFHVVVRGYSGEDLIDEVQTVESISRALTAATEWDKVLEVARSPELRWVVTNATEAGYAVAEGDSLTAIPPASLPLKLAAVLWERYRAGGSPLTLLPCELIERNAEKLREIVVSLAVRAGLAKDFIDWVTDQCLWLNNLVDCIVTPPPADHPLTAQDPLFIQAEPYTLWAIEKPANRVVPLFEHPAIRLVDNLQPFYLRKVRMLNGLHTAMTAKFLPHGFVTVQQVLGDPTANRWVRDVLFEEIVPTLVARVEGVAEFADQTYDRLRNPFQQHRLADIAMNHQAKKLVRLAPTCEEYQKLYGRPPQRLSDVLSWDPPT